MHLADIPRHVSRRKCDIQSCSDTRRVYRINVLNPDRHPDALIFCLIAILLEGGGVCAAAEASLRTPAQKYSAHARPKRAERRRRSPIPELLPSPLFKPGKAGGHVGYVQYRSQTVGIHDWGRITSRAAPFTDGFFSGSVVAFSVRSPKKGRFSHGSRHEPANLYCCPRD